MSPAPVPRHQTISATLMAEVVIAIRKANCNDCKVYNFIDFVIVAVLLRKTGVI